MAKKIAAKYSLYETLHLSDLHYLTVPFWKCLSTRRRNKAHTILQCTADSFSS